jgi:hypothetical protein
MIDPSKTVAVLMSVNRSRHTSPQHNSRTRTRGPAAALGALVLCCAALGAVSSTASASGGPVYTPGPGASYNTTFWTTVSKSKSAEQLWVRGFGQSVARANSCRYGMSVWYTDTGGTRRNIAPIRDGCTWTPTWWFDTNAFIAKRHTTVLVSYRWDGNWYPGRTFRIK